MWLPDVKILFVSSCAGQNTNCLSLFSTILCGLQAPSGLRTNSLVHHVSTGALPFLRCTGCFHIFMWLSHNSWHLLVTWGILFGPLTPDWVVLEVKGVSYLHFYSIANYNVWLKIIGSINAEWMTQSISEIIFVFPYVKQSSKSSQQESLPSGLDMSQSLVFLCLSPFQLPHHGFLALSM